MLVDDEEREAGRGQDVFPIRKVELSPAQQVGHDRIGLLAVQVNQFDRQDAVGDRPAERHHDQGEGAGVKSIDEIGTRPLFIPAQTPPSEVEAPGLGSEVGARGRFAGALADTRFIVHTERPIPGRDGADRGCRISTRAAQGAAFAPAVEGRFNVRPRNPAYAAHVGGRSQSRPLMIGGNIPAGNEDYPSSAIVTLSAASRLVRPWRTLSSALSKSIFMPSSRAALRS